VVAVSPNGVLGDPAGASAAEGAETVAVMAAALREALHDWHVDERGRLGPTN
jgi:creatinine amidohydrolase